MSTREPRDEDVESAITGLERRLRALQAELDAERGAPASAGEPAPAPPPPAGRAARRDDPRACRALVSAPAPAAAAGAGRAHAAPGAGPGPAPRPAAPAPDPFVDALERFGADLRRLTDELNASWERLVADVRTGGGQPDPVFSGEVALEVEARLGTLAAMNASLSSIRGVRSVALRTYAGRRRRPRRHASTGRSRSSPSCARRSAVPSPCTASGPGLLAIDVGETD